MNREVTGQRNLAVSQWHRKAFPDDFGAFDHDLVGMCAVPLCRQPLYVFEDVYANGTPLAKAGNMKPANWCGRVAERWGVPAILIAWSGDVDSDRLEELMAWRVSLQHPSRVLIGGREELERYIRLVRRAHDAVHHAEPTRKAS